MTDPILSVPPEFRRGGKKGNEAKSEASAIDLIQLTCGRLGHDSLAGLQVLDMGCGSKLVQAILNQRLPVGGYTGVDISQPLIDFLRANVADDRFRFHFMNTHNAMYNPNGTLLDAHVGLPFEPASFDVICLFSVFTHLAPDDYVAMLKLLRPYMKPQGRIIFSLFVNETTAGGYGWMDGVKRDVENSLGVRPDRDDSRPPPEPPDFIDANPEKPLFRAIYSRKYALRLLEGTGWELESLNDPEEYIQHYMICRPV